MQEYLVVAIETSICKGMSNLPVDKEVFFKSNNELPNSSVSVKEDSFIVLWVLRRLILLSSIKGQCRKKRKVNSISIPQLQRGLMQF